VHGDSAIQVGDAPESRYPPPGAAPMIIYTEPVSWSSKRDTLQKRCGRIAAPQAAAGLAQRRSPADRWDFGESHGLRPMVLRVRKTLIRLVFLGLGVRPAAGPGLLCDGI